MSKVKSTTPIVPNPAAAATPQSESHRVQNAPDQMSAIKSSSAEALVHVPTHGALSPSAATDVQARAHENSTVADLTNIDASTRALSKNPWSQRFTAETRAFPSPWIRIVRGFALGQHGAPPNPQVVDGLRRMPLPELKSTPRESSAVPRA